MEIVNNFDEYTFGDNLTAFETFGLGLENLPLPEPATSSDTKCPAITVAPKNMT